MTAGQSYPVSITFRNTGTATWSNTSGPGTPNAFSLGPQNPQDNVRWGLNPYATRVPVAGTVAPGATTTFTFMVVAPAASGTYDFQWQMVDDFVAWFGDLTPNLKVTVLPASGLLGAKFVSQSVPASMTAGQSYPVAVTFKNTGTATWSNTSGPGTPNAFSLGPQNPQDNVRWGLSPYATRLPVVGTVAPGATTTFTFTIVAPATSGTYDFQWQMVDDFVAWFGDLTPNLKVTVLPASGPAFGALLGAQFVSQSVPTSMTTGERYPVSVTFKNTGTATWSNSSGPGTPNAFSLGPQNPQDNVRWGLSPYATRVPVVGTVAPGATTTFTFTIVAPATSGTYDFQWQMVDDFVAWFGNRTPNVSVLVGSPINFVTGPISLAASFPFAQPVIGDFDGDGWLEPFGTINDGTGRLAVRTLTSMGVDDMLSPVRPDDFRVADLDGDGCPDLVAQGYSAYSQTTNLDARALLYFNNGTGTFTADAAFASRNFNGRGEGLVFADFNNDGATDLYLPYYTFGSVAPCMPDDECPNSPRSYLLLNDGTGHFIDGDVPGTVDLTSPPGGQPEGVQAVDINDDGRIDLYVAGHLFLNLGPGADGRVRFVDCNCGVPRSSDGLLVDEGAKFLDWNNDGKLDLILHDAYGGPELYQNVGTRVAPRFVHIDTRAGGLGPQFAEKYQAAAGTAYRSLSFCASFGMNVYDLDNDGLEDVVVAGSVAPSSPDCDYPNVVFRNTGTGFESVDAGAISGWDAGGVAAFGDFNRDGRIDAMYVGPFPYYFINATNTATRGAFTVDVRGPTGAQNQHGRVVRVAVPAPGCASGAPGPGCTLTRVVDGGSGYHTQSQYPILVGTPYAGAHSIEVLFPSAVNPSVTTAVHALAAPGQYVQVLAPSLLNPGGRVIYGRPSGTTCRAG